MNLVEHLKSPQFTDEQGRPTNKNRFNRMLRLTAPGTPRWVGYLTGLVVFVLGVLALFAWNPTLTTLGIVFIGSAIYIALEVWRGEPFWSRDRIDYPPPEDEGQPSKPGGGGRIQPPPLEPPPPHWQPTQPPRNPRAARRVTPL